MTPVVDVPRPEARAGGAQEPTPSQGRMSLSCSEPRSRTEEGLVGKGQSHHSQQDNIRRSVALLSPEQAPLP